MSHIGFALSVLVTAAVFAWLEIQIEGPHGWAANLPTWRLDNRWTRIFFGHRPLTGYHVGVQAWVFCMAHLPFTTGMVHFGWPAELHVLSFIVLFFIVEDFLWFVANPAYGFRAFRKDKIWWHAPTWWWIMPRDYWVFLPLGCLVSCSPKLCRIIGVK